MSGRPAEEAPPRAEHYWIGPHEREHVDDASLWWLGLLIMAGFGSLTIAAIVFGILLLL